MRDTPVRLLFYHSLKKEHKPDAMYFGIFLVLLLFSHNSGESVVVVMHVFKHAKSINSLSERDLKQNPTVKNTHKWNTDKLLHSENGTFGLISHRYIFLVLIVGESFVVYHAFFTYMQYQAFALSKREVIWTKTKVNTKYISPIRYERVWLIIVQWELKLWIDFSWMK